MIDFYTNPRSRGALARWMLEEVGAPYTTHVLGYDTTMKAPEFLAINPMGKVPAIVHNGKIVTEGAAICAYLADVFAQAGLAPALAERDQYYRWLFFAAGPLEQAVINTSLGFVASPEHYRRVGYGHLDHVIEALDRHLSQTPFFAGDRFTAADVYAGSHIGWGIEFGSMPVRPSFINYWNRIKNRPARLRAAKLDTKDQEA